MKILMVTTSNVRGGAARAAYRLHEALLRSGAPSQMLVQHNIGGDANIIGPTTKKEAWLAKMRLKLDRIAIRPYKKTKTSTPFAASWQPFGDIVDKINALAPDIVHLHWICEGMMTVEDLAKIKAPIVWTLHDMWPFTGGCHYDEECGKYTTGCSRCPALGSKKERDLSAKIFARKKKTYNAIPHMTIVAISEWMAQCAKESILLGDASIVTLPNPLDTQRFKPVDKQTARYILNIPTDKKLILYGATGATSNPRKGFKELSSALDSIDGDDCECIVFGGTKPDGFNEPRHKTHYLGQVSDDITLSILYSAADVMVVPSIQEAFGQTASEAMSCGTPVVAFGATGLLDIIDHKVTGYLAKPFDIKDLAAGIRWVVDNPDHADLCRAARKAVEERYSYEILAQHYLQMYHSILARSDDNKR